MYQRRDKEKQGQHEFTLPPPKSSFIILTSPQGDGDIWKITYDLK